MRSSQSENETRRLHTLTSYAILDSLPEPDYDDVALLARAICDTPIALITLVDESRQWFKSKIGLEISETNRQSSFCAHALEGVDFLEVPDAILDERFVNNPLVVGEPGIRFYAGAPLLTPEGEVLGTLCVIDCQPRELSEMQKLALQVLSRQVMTQMELRRRILRERDLSEQLIATQEARDKSDRHARQIFENNPLPAWIHDPETLRFLAVNDAAIACYGYSREEFLEMTITDILPSEDVPRLIEAIQRLATNPAQFTNRAHGDRAWRHLKKDGTLIHDEITCWPEQFMGKNCRMAQANNISLQVNAEETLRKNEASLARAQSIAHVGSWTIPADRQTVLCSAECCRIHGIDPSRTTLSIEEFKDLLHPDDRTGVIAAQELALAGGASLDMRYRIVQPDGSIRWLHELTTLETYPSGAPLELHGTVQDITDNRQKEERLLLLDTCLSRLNDLVVITEAETPDGASPRIIFVNDAFERRTGYSREEVIGRPPKILQGPKTDRATLDRIRAALKAWKPIREELINYTKSGEEFWLELEIIPVANEKCWFTHWIAVERDITERKISDAALRASKDSLQFVLESSKSGYWDLDIVNNKATRSLRHDECFGYSELQPHWGFDTFLSHVHHLDRVKVELAFQDAQERNSDINVEFRVIWPDQSVHWLLCIGRFHRDEAGNTLRASGLKLDITERKLTERQLAEQAAALDNAHEAILITDLDDRIIYWNKAATRIYGWTSSEAIGRTAGELLHKNPAAYSEVFAVLMANGEWHGTMQKLTKTGKTLELDLSRTLLRDENGQPKSVLAIDTDITEKLKLESQSLRNQRLESIGTLAGGIAHDLNNVLAPILMSIEILKMKFPGHEAGKLLDTLLFSAERGAGLVKQILSFARGVESQRVPVDPVHILREIQQVARDTFPKSITFQLQIPDFTCTVYGDPSQLHQIFLNLCVNARDAMPNGGHIDISIGLITVDDTFIAMHPELAPGSYSCIKVTDNGSGIPPEVRDRIFEPFFTTKEVGKGTGLGLSTTMGILKNHHGLINLYSEVGRGTTFSVYLPIYDPTINPYTFDPKLEQFSRGRGELILVVDDEEPIRKVVEATLLQFGYQVLLASNGTEALDLYNAHRSRIALVLTDMAMPVMDGPATILALRAIDPEIKIVGSSGLFTNRSISQRIGGELTHFVPKPYTAETLLQKLHQLLY